MGMIHRLVVVGWMVGGLIVVAFAVALPLFLAYGVAEWWRIPDTTLHSLEVVLTWISRFSVLLAVWLAAKGASVAAGSHGPSRALLAIGGWLGLALGIPIGLAVRNAWGVAILSALGLPFESYSGDVVLVCVLLAYGAAIFASTYLPAQPGGVA
jgi:hypothetical protein